MRVLMMDEHDEMNYARNDLCDTQVLIFSWKINHIQNKKRTDGKKNRNETHLVVGLDINLFTLLYKFEYFFLRNSGPSK